MEYLPKSISINTMSLLDRMVGGRLPSPDSYRNSNLINVTIPRTSELIEILLDGLLGLAQEKLIETETGIAARHYVDDVIVSEIVDTMDPIRLFNLRNKVNKRLKKLKAE